MVKLYEHITKRLQEIESTSAFAHSGMYTHEMLNYLNTKKTDLKLITLNSPEEAIFAADGFAKSKRIQDKTSTIGCAIVSFGPSSFSSISALCGSFTEKSPLMIINGTPSLKNQIKDDKTHELLKKSLEIFSKLTFQSIRLYSNEMNGKIIDNIMEVCLMENKPIYIEIPEDVIGMEIKEIKSNLKIVDIVSSKKELKTSVETIVKLIKDKKNILVWVGSEVYRKNLSHLVEDFLKKTKLNWATSVISKSVLNEKEIKNFVGVYCGRSSSKHTFDAFKKAEFILSFGVTTFEIEHLKMSIEDELPCDKKYIGALNNYVRSSDHKYWKPVALHDLINELNKKVEEISDSLKPYYTEFVYDLKNINYSDELTYDSVAHHLVKLDFFTKKNVVVDSTLALFPFVTVPLKGKNCFFSQISFGYYGYSLPATVGIFEGTKKQMVVVIGDGGFQNMFQTVGSLVKYKIDCVILLFSNGCVGLNQWNQNPKAFKSGEFDEHNVLTKWKFDDVVKSLGGKCTTVKTHEELKKVIGDLSGYEKKSGVHVVNMLIPKKDYPKSVGWNIEK